MLSRICSGLKNREFKGDWGLKRFVFNFISLTREHSLSYFASKIPY